jgi:hypothetical protein
MIGFYMFFSGKWRKCIKLCGTPCLAMVDLEKASDMAYQDVLDEFDLVWCVKGLIVPHIDLVVWKVRPQMATIS